jgi:tRNA 2-thiouridine synthesizing protein E
MQVMSATVNTSQAPSFDNETPAKKYTHPRLTNQDIQMKQHSINAYSIESSSHELKTRKLELKSQHWNREKSRLLAESENIILNDDHWAVITYLRKRYLKDGLPRHARTLASDLNQKFLDEGGTKYLFQLFAGGPVTQGSRLANLSSPSSAKDMSFGSCY